MTRYCRLCSVALLCLALGVLALPHPALAKSHLWKFKEIFSNADGSIQYVEMDVLDPAGTGEWVTLDKQLASRDHVYLISVNLPQENTFLRSMLFATPAFAAFPGAPTPDFLTPPATSSAIASPSTSSRSGPASCRPTGMLPSSEAIGARR